MNRVIGHRVAEVAVAVVKLQQRRNESPGRNTRSGCVFRIDGDGDLVRGRPGSNWTSSPDR
jgi:hypothetical protein